ncbi:MAG: FecR domain-containing protein [Ferruginibacter sp.]|nr:FecR domain-containing protein [Ferruginibacter sp.]
MTFNNKDITAIILKNEYDACTLEELQVLEQWYNSLDDKTQLDKFNNRNKELEKDKIWEAVTGTIDANETKEASVVKYKTGRTIFYYIARVAAILIVFAGSYLTFSWLNNKQAAVTVENIQYVSQTNNSNKPTKIILPDNSLLWLAANASIKYPKHFINSRNILLQAGKVFFNVAHDAFNPFTVETVGGLKTTVVGTAFVMEQGGTNSLVKVSVLRGKVQVADKETKHAILTRNQGVEVNSNTKVANFIVVDSLEMTGWFASKVELDNVTLKEVASSINQTFGYTIEFSTSKLSGKRCSITYSATDNVDDIIILLDKIYHTKHNFSGNKIYIKPLR